MTISGISRFLCSKGIDAVRENEHDFVLEDPLGRRSAAVHATSVNELSDKLYTLASVRPLAAIDGRALELIYALPNSANLRTLDDTYLTLPDACRAWFVQQDQMLWGIGWSVLPTAYLDCGYGAGSSRILEMIHRETLKTADSKASPVSREMVFGQMYHRSLERICDDIRALISRAFLYFHRLLDTHRAGVVKAAPQLVLLDSKEVIQRDDLGTDTSTYLTGAILSLSTSLDLSAKLVAYVNELVLPLASLQTPRGLIFSDLGAIKPRRLSAKTLQHIRDVWSGRTSIVALIQARHDLIHGTTALELERHFYVGTQTPVINGLPLHYCQQLWRDTEPSGQPVRCLGRDFFTDQVLNVEEVLAHWIVQVLDGHATVARLIGPLFAWST